MLVKKKWNRRRIQISFEVLAWVKTVALFWNMFIYDINIMLQVKRPEFIARCLRCHKQECWEDQEIFEIATHEF